MAKKARGVVVTVVVVSPVCLSRIRVEDGSRRQLNPGGLGLNIRKLQTQLNTETTEYQRDDWSRTIIFFPRTIFTLNWIPPISNPGKVFRG